MAHSTAFLVPRQRHRLGRRTCAKAQREPLSAADERLVADRKEAESSSPTMVKPVWGDRSQAEVRSADAGLF